MAYKAIDDENRKKLLANSITLLQEGSEAIKKVLIRRINDFEEIPKKSTALRVKMFFSPTNYVEKIDEDFDEIQDCFDYYDRAQKLTAIACLMMNEPQSMEEVFFEQEKFIEGLNLSRLKGIESLHNTIDFSKEWFHAPKEFLDSTRLQYLDFTEGNYNVVSLEVTGKQMLEVLKDVKNERPEERQECEA